MASSTWSKAVGEQRWRSGPGARRGTAKMAPPASSKAENEDGVLSLEEGGGTAKMAPSVWSKAGGVLRESAHQSLPAESSQTAPSKRV